MTINSFRHWIKREIESLDGADCPDNALPSIGDAKQIALQLGLPDVVRCLTTVTTTMLASSTAKLVLCECLAMLPTHSETLTPPQVAKLLRVGTEKVLRWIRVGELHATNVTIKPGGRAKYRIVPTDLEAFQKRRTPQAPIKTKRLKRPSGKVYL